MSNLLINIIFLPSLASGIIHKPYICTVVLCILKTTGLEIKLQKYKIPCMCFCSDALYGHCITLSTVLYIAFWDQLSKIGIFHGNRLQYPQLKK